VTYAADSAAVTSKRSTSIFRPIDHVQTRKIDLPIKAAETFDALPS